MIVLLSLLSVFVTLTWLTKLKSIHDTHRCSIQRWIQVFQEGGANLLFGQNFVENGMKMKNGGRGGGHASETFTACKRTLGQGNVFPPVCDSLHGGSAPLHGGIHPLGRHPLGRHPPGRHPLGRDHPGQRPPRQTPHG